MNVKLEWIEIPVGEFLMGTSEIEVKSLIQKCKSTWFEHEEPQQSVYLDSFAISKFTVTNAQYKIFLDATGYKWAASPYFLMYQRGEADYLGNHPVAWISLYDALAFCRWAGCRLPTGPEWEKAARGAHNFKYPWGDTWEEEYCNWGGSKHKMTTAVGAYPHGVSPYGVLDMAGNVWEWTDDWITSGVAPQLWRMRIATQPLKSSSKTQIQDESLPHIRPFPVLRGGAVNTNAIGLRCAFRLIKYLPFERGDWVGFRCVKC